MAIVAATKVVGLQKAMDRIAAYNASRAKPTLDAAALAGANVAKRWIEEKMVEPKSGIKWPQLPYRSSAPGEVPSVQFEDLVKSLNTRNEDSGSPYIGRAICGVGAESESGFRYAIALEYGGPQLKARPYMRPSVDENKDAIARAMEDVCNEEWKVLSGRVGPSSSAPTRADVISGIAAKLG